MAKLIFLVSELGVAKLKCHRPIMVNVAEYAMRFATGQELPRELSFGVEVGDPIGSQNKNLAKLIFLVFELGGGKVEVS